MGIFPPGNSCSPSMGNWSPSDFLIDRQWMDLDLITPVGSSCSGGDGFELNDGPKMGVYDDGLEQISDGMVVKRAITCRAVIVRSV